MVNQGFVVDPFYLGIDYAQKPAPAPQVVPADRPMSAQAGNSAENRPAKHKVAEALLVLCSRCDRHDATVTLRVVGNGRLDRHWCDACYLKHESWLAAKTRATGTHLPADYRLPRPAPLAVDETVTWGLLPEAGR
jgi:hypothetical protein